MSEEIALAAADLATVEQLRARILEWEDAYDRLAGAFDLHMAIGECQSALSDYAGGYYDVVLGEMAAQAERAETQRKAWTELGAQAQADAAAFKEALEHRHTCENCGGKGSYWTDVGGEAEYEVCDCWIRADHVLYHEEHPGAALLAELEAARAMSDALEVYRDAERAAEADPTRLSEKERRRHELGVAWSAYIATVKARTE